MKKIVYIISLALTILFFIIGALNLYGNSPGRGDYMVFLAFAMVITYVLSIILAIKNRNGSLLILFVVFLLVIIALLFGLSVGGL